MIDTYSLVGVLFYTVVGLCIGSFLNVVIYRLPIMLSATAPKHKGVSRGIKDNSLKDNINLCFPKSFCPNCNSPLLIRYNIPVVSWLLLRGRSRCCQQRINPRYLIVELLTAILTLLVAFWAESDYSTVACLLLIWSLITLSFIDLDCYLLPDCITLPLLWIGLVFNINNVFCSLSSAVLGAVVGYVFLWLPYWLFKLLKGVEGMGYGDFKLMAAMGAWFGVSAIPMLILLSSGLGIIISMVISLLSKKKVKHIAFGPYICLAGMAHLFLGEVVSLF
ncbi:prepilin peptidase [Yersinia sp. 2540 StPb PI]|uniref:prepilin peptidase n=1 Tax=Yersinia sp. 2540 StPb PI TaxID=3117406 RepID=UPI003FA4C15C